MAQHAVSEQGAETYKDENTFNELALERLINVSLLMGDHLTLKIWHTIPRQTVGHNKMYLEKQISSL